MLLIFLSCAWIIGIFLGFRFNLPPILLLSGALPIILLFFTRRFNRQLILASLGIVILVGAAIYSYSYQSSIGEEYLNFYNDRGSVEIKGTVASDPDVRNMNARLIVNVTALRLDEEWHNITGKALVLVSRYPTYNYGDVLIVTGELQTPSITGEFDYKGYLEHQGINTIIYYPKIAVLDTGRGFPLMAWIYDLRNRLADVIAEVLPEPQAVKMKLTFE